MLSNWLMVGSVLLIISFFLFHPTKSLKWIPNLLLGIFMCAFPILGIAFQVHAFKTNTAAEDWPTVTGFVTKSEIARRSALSLDEEGGNSYSPVVNFDYTVDGVTYGGTNIDAQDLGMSYPRAHEIIAKYPVGSQVNVYWNPENPEDSLLHIGRPVSAVSWILLVAYMYFLLLVIAFTRLSILSTLDSRHS